MSDHPIAATSSPSSRTRAATLAEHLGAPPPGSCPATELDDLELRRRLWATIRGLAHLGLFLVHTDHLDDRALYERIRRDLLPEPLPDRTAASGVSYEIYDLLGDWVDHDVETYLRFYADDAEREMWSRFPQPPEVPPRERAPFDRDRRLPTPFASS